MKISVAAQFYNFTNFHITKNNSFWLAYFGISLYLFDSKITKVMQQLSIKVDFAKILLM